MLLSLDHSSACKAGDTLSPGRARFNATNLASADQEPTDFFFFPSLPLPFPNRGQAFPQPSKNERSLQWIGCCKTSKSLPNPCLLTHSSHSWAASVSIKASDQGTKRILVLGRSTQRPRCPMCGLLYMASLACQVGSWEPGNCKRMTFKVPI